MANLKPEVGTNTSPKVKREKETIEIWGDNVNIKDLLLAIIICVVTTLGGYLIAPAEPPKPLVFGLVGGVIGFTVSAILIKPKRTITYSGEEE
ncbi:hypothetical protein M3936_12325 [Sutcliffiella horikoshii]|uniref:hypothetical protein n=1 Tax=Sutcliffiella horikoshii TaxID=79883 RepID=UPI00203EE0DE|nr:hypothetical protein [Sutcliffiella horikoshii]MCM3618367.1 hypothetical protein [Sutcliffiella horikoshii]